jgi:hypothetical protein
MILDQHGICRDAAFAGEIDRLMDRRGIRLRYLRPAGLTVDAIGELLVDRRITDSRPTCREVLDMLELALTPAPIRPVRVKASLRAVDAAEGKARTNRLRKFACPSCSQIARGTRCSVLACGLCYEMRGEVIMLRRVDPLPEEVIAMAMEAA